MSEKNGRQLPRISIVTPSYNQAPFFKQCIRSALDQEYPDLEYFIFGGGSTDASASIFRRYEGYLAYRVTEPDRGSSDAIRRSLRAWHVGWSG